MSLKDTFKLSNNTEIPVVGFGTWRATDEKEAYDSVYNAIKAGYRHIDTAEHYHNETFVGNAINDAINDGLVSREELFVTTKLWNDSHDYDLAKKQFSESLERLKLDYVDLYLIHWPNPIELRENNAWKKGNAEAWRAMEELYEQGLTKAIGVSNFLQHHLEALKETQKIAPMVNQIMINPYDQQSELAEYNEKNGMINEGYSPLGHGGDLLNDVILKDIADKYNKNIAQVALRWSLQKGYVPLPKSVHNERIIENTEIFDFELTMDEMKKISALEVKDALHFNPDEAEF